jgi:hypothetical protein
MFSALNLADTTSHRSNVSYDDQKSYLASRGFSKH